MKTQKVGGFTVHLKSVYGEYNCGNKTVGRLELVVKDKDDGAASAFQIGAELNSKKVRDAVIKDYLHNMTLKETFTQLKEGSLMFPQDTGTYVPGILVYADRIMMNQSYTWYNNWKALIEIFEKNPDFGVTVIKTPILPNKFYGVSAPSRVWTICLPGVAEFIAWDKKAAKPMLTYLKSIWESYSSPLLKGELETLGAAVK